MLGLFFIFRTCSNYSLKIQLVPSIPHYLIDMAYTLCAWGAYKMAALELPLNVEQVNNFVRFFVSFFSLFFGVPHLLLAVPSGSPT